jgi:superfamily II DNA helicase RecQ
LSNEGSSIDHYARKVKELQDQLDEAPTKEAKESKIRDLVVAIFGFEPRPKQLEALVCVVAERKDLILIAKTSFGKSLIPQAVPLLLRGQVIICILPLNVIGEEQVEKVARLPGANPIHIRADNVDQKNLLLSVCQGAYTHIYVSPELLVGPKFLRVLRNVTFRNHVALVVVDELHLVHDWEKFRKSYAQLFTVKMRLGAVPWAGLTATCDEVAMQSIDRPFVFGITAS